MDMLVAAALALAALQPSPALKSYAEEVARFTASEQLPSQLESLPPAQAGKLLAELRGMPVANARLLSRHALVMHVNASFHNTLRGSFAAAERHAEMFEKLLEVPAFRAGSPEERAKGAALRRAARISRGHDLLRRWQPSRALAVLERVLREEPGEPDALLAAGMAEELRATRPALALERYIDRSAWSEGRKPASKGNVPKPKERERDQAKSLRVAESLLRRASQSPSVRNAARLHLGAVLLALKRQKDAVVEWQGVLEGGPDPEQASLARLFLGRAAEQDQDWQAAAAHYRGVLQGAPLAQSASLGLTHALDRLQDRAGARAVLVAVLAGDGAGDPWVQYLYAPAQRQKAVLEGLKESLR